MDNGSSPKWAALTPEEIVTDINTAVAEAMKPAAPIILPCAHVEARQKQDKRKGFTTSRAVIDFIRRTCACNPCKAWRAYHAASTSATRLR